MSDKTPKDLLDWLGLTNAPNWKVARPLGMVLGVVLILMFASAIVGALAVIIRTIFGMTEVNLGAGALIAALLGAPFLIWGTVIKHNTQTYQKEGHMTDRIAKAVEQLGAEKTVDRIGRAVTIWTGKPERVNYDAIRADAFTGKPRTKVYPKEWEQSWNPESEDVDEGYRSSVSTWPDERTVIQWKGQHIEKETHEEIGFEGPWQTISETKPNIEVRIGAILSLERIAKDSTTHDNGRDHVSIMEILCAYIRENAPAKNLDPTPGLKKPATPRIDLQMAMDVIKRRSEEQRTIETIARYRLDLRGANLDGFDMSNGHFAGAIFYRSRLEATILTGADLTAARLHECLLDFANFTDALLRGTILNRAKITVDFWEGLYGANLGGVFIEAASFKAFRILKRHADEFFGSADTTIRSGQHEAKKVGLRAADDAHMRELRDETEEPSAIVEHLSDDAKFFLHWNPYMVGDGAASIFRDKYRQRKGLIGWPFDDE